MISTHIKAWRSPRVLAVFSFRYDAHLVPALIENIAPLVDGWVSYDDRNAEAVFSDECRRRFQLLTAARDAGAGWVLAVDPDERFEARLAAEIPALTQPTEPCCYTFPLREMYSERHYRVDGVWGGKRQARLLSLRNAPIMPAGELHLPWSYFIPEHHLIDTEFNLYHLKMITPERRRARAALYSHLDPDRRMQPLGYDYLANDKHAKLEAIPPGRAYVPPHREDGDLWMPHVTARE